MQGDDDSPITISPHRRRLKRREGAGDARFLTFSCFQRRPFLKSERACQWFLEALQRAREMHAVHLWAWVIMPEHVHVILRPTARDTTIGPVLITIKQSVARKTVEWVKRHAPAFLDRMADVAPSGDVVHRFWQRGGGFDRNLDSREGVWNSIRYIHLNPVERGLVREPTDWPWSSAREFAQPGSGPIPIDHESLLRA